MLLITQLKLLRAIAYMLLCVCIVVLTSTGSACAKTVDPSKEAMTQFNAKQYQLAAASFHKAIAANPGDSTLYYYYALCLQYCKDSKGARATYNQIIQYFPGTDAAGRSQTAIYSLDQAVEPIAPTVQPRTPTPTGSTRPDVSSDDVGRSRGYLGTISGPDECNIHFERENNSLVLDGAVNGRPIKMIFDTGAEMCAFGKNHLQEMGIPAPTGAPTGMSHGVGEGGAQAHWDMPASVRVGPITRQNFQITVQQEMGGHPLLGQTFFQDFTYTIDNGGCNLQLRRKNKNQGSIYQQKNDPGQVPFVRMGNEIVVQAQVNGRNCPMIFDTGATVCAFSGAQVATLGIAIPEDARIGTVQGVAGLSRASIFPVSSIKLGPIEKRDFDIEVLQNAQLPLPLLGQTFYGDWQFTIDYEGKCIHFLRR